MNKIGQEKKNIQSVSQAQLPVGAFRFRSYCAMVFSVLVVIATVPDFAWVPFRRLVTRSMTSSGERLGVKV